MKKVLLLIAAFMSFSTMAEPNSLTDGRNPSTLLESDMEECQEYYSSAQGEASTEAIFKCKLEYSFWSKYNRNELEKENKSTNQFMGLIDVIAEKNPVDEYIVFPFLMLLFLIGIVISMTKKLIEGREVKLSFREKTKIIFGAFVMSGGFWFAVSTTLVFSVFLMTFFTAKYNEAVLQYRGDSIMTNDEANGKIKVKSLELAKQFALSSLEAKILENQKIMIGVDHEKPLEPQLSGNDFYNCINATTGTFPIAKNTNRYYALNECNKERSLFLEPPQIISNKRYSGTESLYNGLHTAADDFVNEYLKYYCAVSPEGYDNGGANNPVLCSDFRTGEFYKKISLVDRSPSVVSSEQNIIFHNKLKEYYARVSDLYFDYIQTPLTEEEEPSLLEIKEEVSKDAKLLNDRQNPYTTFMSLVFTRNQICSSAGQIEDVDSFNDLSSVCSDKNNLPNIYKAFRFDALNFTDSKYVGKNEAVQAAYETGTESFVRTDLGNLLQLVNKDTLDNGDILNDREFFIHDPIEGYKFNYSKGLIVKELFISCEDNTNLRNCEMVMSTIPNIYLYYKTALISSVVVYGIIDASIKGVQATEFVMDKKAKPLKGAGITEKKFRELKTYAQKKKELAQAKEWLEYRKSNVKAFMIGTLFSLLTFFFLIMFLCWRVLSVIVHGSLISHIIAPFLFINGNFAGLFSFLANIAINITATVVAVIISTLVFNFGLSIMLEILMAVMGNTPSLYIVLKSNIFFMLTTLFYSMFLFLIIGSIIKAIGEDLSISLENEVSNTKGEFKRNTATMQKSMPSVFGR